MELFDYIRFRWLPLALLAIVGVAAVLFLGRNSGATQYDARTQMVLRPAGSQLAQSGNNLDNYIATQMQLLYSPDYLTAEVNGTDASATELARSLNYIHAAGSAVVTLEVSSSSAARAVALANAAATGYLAQAQDSGTSLATEQSAALAKQIKGAKKQLDSANSVIARTLTNYAAANPDRPVPAAMTLAPRAASDAELATSRLQSLLQQKSTDDIQSETDASTSEIIKPATSAVLPGGWGRTTYLAGFVGVLLVVLVLAGVGLGLSNRVISPARWISASDGFAMRRTTRLKRLSRGRRRDTIRRTQAALMATNPVQTVTWAVYFPEASRRLTRSSAFLIAGLANEGASVSETVSMASLVSPDPAPADEQSTAEPGRVLLLVDLKRASLEDVNLLLAHSVSLQQLLVPVLV